MGNFVTCNPSEAIIVSGMCTGARPTTMAGGRLWVWGCGLQDYGMMSLNAITLNIISKRVNSKLGPAVNAAGVAQIKILSDPDNPAALQKAAELFLGKPQNFIHQVALETLEGHQRAIIGGLTIEEMFKDKDKFSQSVLFQAKQDLVSLGLTIVSYTLTSLTDDNGYLESLGLPEIKKIQAEQSIGELEKLKDAKVNEYENLQKQDVVKYQTKTAMLKNDLDNQLANYENQKEVETHKAKEDSMIQFQTARNNKAIKAEELDSVLIERQRQIEVMVEEINLKREQLKAKVIQPTNAKVYRIKMEAQAKGNQILKEAEAKAEAIRMKGDADAYAITEKAKAEAEQLKKKAEAFNEFKGAALIDVVLKIMPQIAAEISAPLNNANKISMVTSGDGTIGAARIAGEVMKIMEDLPGVVEKLTGVDISADLKAIARSG